MKITPRNEGVHTSVSHQLLCQCDQEAVWVCAGRTNKWQLTIAPKTESDGAKNTVSRSLYYDTTEKTPGQ